MTPLFRDAPFFARLGILRIRPGFDDFGQFISRHWFRAAADNVNHGHD